MLDAGRISMGDIRRSGVEVEPTNSSSVERSSAAMMERLRASVLEMREADRTHER
jgi:hypothetical protein